MLAEELRIGRAALRQRMRVLVAAGAGRPKRAQGWIIDRRDEESIAASRQAIGETV